MFWLKDRATENVSNRAHLQTFEWKTLEGFAGHNTERHTHTFFRVADPGSGLGPYPVLKCVKRNCKVRHSLPEGAGKR